MKSYFKSKKFLMMLSVVMLVMAAFCGLAIYNNNKTKGDVDALSLNIYEDTSADHLCYRSSDGAYRFDYDEYHSHIYAVDANGVKYPVATVPCVLNSNSNSLTLANYYNYNYPDLVEGKMNIVIVDGVGYSLFVDFLNDYTGHNYLSAANVFLVNDITTQAGIANRFDGYFDGQGHAITFDNDIVEAAESSEYYCGRMFERLHGTIVNLKLKNVNMKSTAGSGGKANFGGMVGRCYGTINGCIVENCKFISERTGSSKLEVAPIAGCVESGGSVTNCMVTGGYTLSAGKDFWGTTYKIYANYFACSGNATNSIFNASVGLEDDDDDDKITGTFVTPESQDEWGKSLGTCAEAYNSVTHGSTWFKYLSGYGFEGNSDYCVYLTSFVTYETVSFSAGANGYLSRYSVSVPKDCVTVTYNSNGTATVYGQTVTATGNTGYKFKEWSGNTATFQGITYYVAYIANGGSGTMTKSTYTYGDTASLRWNNFYKTDSDGNKYVFLGWATSQNGSVEYADGQSISNLIKTDGETKTLYAVWEKLPNYLHGRWQSIVYDYIENDYASNFSTRIASIGFVNSVPSGFSYLCDMGATSRNLTNLKAEDLKEYYGYELENGDYHAIGYNDDTVHGGVQAYYKITTGSDGYKYYNLAFVAGTKIYAPTDCSDLFRTQYDLQLDGDLVTRDFLDFSGLTSITFDNFNTSGVTDMNMMFLSCLSLTSLDLSSFNTSSVTDMSCMFDGCSNLTSLDLSGWDVSSVTTMVNMFFKCYNLATITGIDDFNPTAVTSLYQMFYDCSSLSSLDLSGWKMPLLTNASGMFTLEFMDGNSLLTELDLSGWDTPLLDSDGMLDFQGLSALETLNLAGWNLGNVTSLAYLFSGCSALTSLDLSSFNTSSVTDMSYMFEDCSSLVDLKVNGWDVSYVDDMTGMFLNCSSLTELDLSGWVTSSAIYMADIFTGCSSIISLNLSNFDISHAKDLEYNEFVLNFTNNMVDKIWLPAVFGANYVVVYSGSTMVFSGSYSKAVDSEGGYTFDDDYERQVLLRAHIVTMYGNGGSWSGSETTRTIYIPVNESVFLPMPTYTGYGCTGWWTAATGGNFITSAGGSYGPTKDISIYAQWQANKYYIEYVGNGATSGSMEELSEHVYGTVSKVLKNDYKKEYTVSYNANGGTVTTTDSNTKSEYAFYGWTSSVYGVGGKRGSTSSSCSYIISSAYTKIYDENYVLNVTYDPMKTVTFSASWDDEDAYVTLPTPTKAGYTFTGWFTSLTGGENKGVSGALFTPTENTTLYAQWTANTYTVTYSAGGGTIAANASYYNGSGVNANKTVTYGQPYTSQIAPSSSSNEITRTGYTFGGFYVANDYRSMSHVSSYLTNANTLRLVTDNSTIQNNVFTAGMIIGVDVTIAGATITGIEVNDRAVSEYQYNIIGGSRIVAYITVEAGQLQNNYSFVDVLVEKNGSYTVSVNEFWTSTMATQVVDTSGKLNASVSGYTDANRTWSKTSNGFLAAKWTANKYTVSYNANGGTGSMTSTTVTYDQPYTLPECTFSWTGYSFSRWYDYEHNVSWADWIGEPWRWTYTYDITLTADKTANTYTVTYNANGGTGSMTSTTVTYKQPYTAPECAFTAPTGYHFSSWNEAADGTGSSWAGYVGKAWTWTYTKNITLYAQWAPNTYTVTYNSNGGSGSMASTTVTYNQPYTAPECAFTAPAGKTFSHWNEAESNNGTSWAGWVGKAWTWKYTNSITLYAQWSVVPYSISYDYAGGTISTANPTSYNVETASFTLGNPTRVGYTFAGWTGSNGTTKQTTVTISKGSTGNKSYTANWTANTYKVTMDANGGTVNQGEISATFDSSVSNIAVPTKTGYTFGGAYSAAGIKDGYQIKNIQLWYDGIWNNGWDAATSTTTTTWKDLSGLNNGTLNNFSSGMWSGNGLVFDGTDSYVVGASNMTLSNTTTWEIVYKATVENRFLLDQRISDAGYQPAYINSTGVQFFDSTTGNVDYVNYTTLNTFNTLTIVKNGTTVSIYVNGELKGTKTTKITSSTTGSVYLGTRHSLSGYFKGTMYAVRIHDAALSATQVDINAKLDANRFNSGTNKIKFFNADGSKNVPVWNLTANTTLYCDWTPNIYKVTLDKQGGTGGTDAYYYKYNTNKNDAGETVYYYTDAQCTVKMGSDSYTLEIPTKTGYTFSGYYSAVNGGGTCYVNEAGQGINNLYAAVANDSKLYAKWTANTYTLTYNANGGFGSMSSSSHTYDTAKALTANAFTRTGYSFAGWNTKADGTGTNYADKASVSNLATSGTFNLYARWIANQYTLTFNANGGSVSTTTKKVTYGQTYSDLPTPTRTGYSFNGWGVSLNGSTFVNMGRDYMFTNQLSFHAEAYMDDWSLYATNSMRIVSCTESGGWNIESSSNNIQFPIYDYGVGYKTVNKSKAWSNLSSGWHSFDIVFDGSKLYAYIDGTLYGSTAEITSGQIGYHSTNSLFIGAEAGSSATTPASGYFNGQIRNFIVKNANSKTTSGLTTSISAPAQNLTLIATWTANTYTVTYNANGGSGSMSSVTHTYDTAQALTENGFTRTGYDFIGWNTAADGTGTSYADKASVKNLTTSGTFNLYAQWKENDLTVTFNANGGTVSPTSKSVTYNSIYGDLPTPTRTGYTFSHWETNLYNQNMEVYKDGYYYNGSTGAYVALAEYDCYMAYILPNTTYTITNSGGSTAPGYAIFNSSGTVLTYKNYAKTKIVTFTSPANSSYIVFSVVTKSSSSRYDKTTFELYGKVDSTVKMVQPANHTLDAVWTANTYNVGYNANGGVVSIAKDEQNVTPYIIDWSKDFSIETSFVYTTQGQRYFIFGNYPGTNHLNVEILGTNKLRVYINNANVDTSSSKNTTKNFSSTVPTGTDVSVKFTWTAGTTKAWSLTASAFNWSDSANGTSTVTGKSQYGIAVGRDYRGTTTDFQAIKVAPLTIKTGTATAVVYPYNLTETYDAEYGTLPTVERIGYTFNGWYTAPTAGTKVEATINVTATTDHVLYAQWTVNNYTLTVNPNGGTMGQNIINGYYANGTASSQVKASTMNYYTDTAGRIVSVGNSSSTTDCCGMTHITANIELDITYTRKMWYSKTVSNQNVGYGWFLNGGYNTYNSVSQWWFMDPVGNAVASTKNFNSSSFKAGVYTLRVDPNTTANTLTVNSTVLYSAYNSSTYTKTLPYSTYYCLDIPTRTGYTFTGWSITSGSGIVTRTDPTYMAYIYQQTATSNVTITAQWTPNTYTVTYNGNGATGGTTANSTHTYDTSSALTENGFTRSGYNFVEWNTAANGTGASYGNKASIKNLTASANGTVTLYAQWGDPINYTITYDLDGGTVSPANANPTSYNVETEPFTLVNPTKTGYTFAGWTVSNGTTKQTTVTIAKGSTGNKTYTANWTANTYTLTYNANSGTVSPASKTVTYDAEYGTLPTPTRTGYTFTGWYTATTGGTLVESTTIVKTASNHTIYARWIGTDYKLTLDAEDYSILEYIESSGTQWINTGYYWKNENIQIVLDAEVTSSSSGMSLFGNEEYISSSSGTRYFGGIPHGGNGTYGIYIGNGNQGEVSIPNNQRFILDIATTTAKNVTAKVDGTTQLSKTYTSTVIARNSSWNNSGYIYLFSNFNSFRNTDTAGIQLIGGMKVYSFKLYDGGVLVRDLIPAIKNNVVGMYDRVENKFYTNAGTGTFTAGYYKATFGESYGTLPTPAWKGYTFTGWYTQETGGSLVESTTKVTTADNHTLSAHKTANKNAVAIDHADATNLIQNPGFENTGWTTNGSSLVYSNEYKRSGNYSMKLTGTTSTREIVVPTTTTIPLVTDHIYYVSVYGYQTTKVGSTVQCYWPIAEPSFGSVSIGAAGQWNLYSFRLARSKGNDGSTWSGNYQLRFDFDNSNAAGVMYFDDAKLIDLTATFGSGNEPTKEWCDANLAGMQTIYPTFDEIMPSITVPTRTGYTFNGVYDAASGGTQYYNSDGTSYNNKKWDKAVNTTLYAHWTANTYTVKYNGNGATGGKTENSTHTYDTSLALTENGFIKTGHTFAGWATSASGNVVYVDKASVVNLTTSGTYTLYAKWTPNSYKITYNGNGATGGSTASSSHTYDAAKALTSNGFTKTGYTFASWNTKADGSGTSYSNQQSVENLTTEDGATVTLYAKWTANKYTILYDGNGATAGLTKEDELSRVYDTPKQLTANGYKREYNVSFDANGGTNNTSELAKYTFAGWATSASGNVVYADKASVVNLTTSGTYTLYAVWTNGPTGVGTAPSKVSVPLPTPTREGYTFLGWYTAKEGGSKIEGTTYTPEQETTLFAHWQINTFTVTWVNYNGEVLETDLKVPYGTTPTYNGTTPEKPMTEKYRYEFEDWSPAVSAVTKDIVYTAQYKDILRTFTVTIDVDPDGWGTVSHTSVAEVPYGTTITVDSNKITINSNEIDADKTSVTVTATPSSPTAQYTYYFEEWTGIVEVKTNMTVTAHFDRRINNYKVTWFNQGGTKTLETDATVEYGTKPSYDGSTPTKASDVQYHYTFAGWNLSKDQETGTAEENLPAIEGNVNYYAAFSKTLRQYTVTFLDDGYGTVSGSNGKTSVTVDYGTAITANGNKVTIGSVTFTATPTTNANGYEYEFKEWLDTTETVGGDLTITADFIRYATISIETEGASGNTHGIEVYNESGTSLGTHTTTFRLETDKKYTIIAVTTLTANASNNEYQVVRISINGSVALTRDSYMESNRNVDNTIYDNEILTEPTIVKFSYFSAHFVAVEVPGDTISGITLTEMNQGINYIEEYSSKGGYVVGDETKIEFTINSIPNGENQALSAMHLFIGFKYIVDGVEYTAGINGGTAISYISFTQKDGWPDGVGVYSYEIEARSVSEKLLSQIVVQTIQSTSVEIDTSELSKLSGSLTLTSEYGLNKVIDKSTTTLLLHKGIWTITLTNDADKDLLKAIFEVEGNGVTVDTNSLTITIS